jgi:selenocysteine lyase/cysteine desulfurase
MLTAVVAPADGAFFDDLRAREFGRLEHHDEAYLDYAGSALYAESHLRAHHALLTRGLFGNPHSEHAPSRASSAALSAAARRVLAFLDADERDYAVVFTANATAAIKLVAESYPFGRNTACVISADNHNSVNGIREYAGRAGSVVEYIPLDGDLRLSHPEARLDAARAAAGGLFAFPAQSNFSGVQHPLSLVRRAQDLGFDVVLDAAAFAAAHPLSLRAAPAEFVALSFYKIFGYPTGLGALVAKRAALARLARPWFAGGTVAFASVALGRHQLHDGEPSFQDGTPNFLDAAALPAGFDLVEGVTMPRLSARVRSLAARLIEDLHSLHHANGNPLVRTYGPPHQLDRGGTVAFNVLDDVGRTVPYWRVEGAAGAARVSLRGGCFCNPGASEAAFGLDAMETARCLDRVGRSVTPMRLRACLGQGSTVGAVRASAGLATNLRDIARLVDVVADFRTRG